MMSKRLRELALLLAGSTLVGLFFASQSVFNPANMGMVSWGKAITVNLTYYYGWGLCVPLIVTLSRRYPFQARRWRQPLAVHLPASVGLTVAVIVVAELLLKYAWQLRPSPTGQLLTRALGANFHVTLPTYWMVLLVAQLRDRDLRASRLEARLTEARLDALKMQLRPHFLFNTLNSISTLMYEDLAGANAMLARLGRFLRTTLEADGHQLVPLARELEFVQQYLDIEQIRFDDRLTVDYVVSEDTLTALVPTLLLQPLVENAIHHAIATRAEGGTVTIGARRVGAFLELAVADDGPGMASESHARVGLSNTRQRLAQLYGSAFEVQFDDSRTRGLTVRIRLPLQLAGPPD